MFDYKNKMEATFTYSPFGVETVDQVSGSNTTSIGFEGGFVDPGGLIYYQQRFYDPTSDQFISVDPDVMSTLQPYSFAGSDPINASDPNGLDRACWGDCQGSQEEEVGETSKPDNETQWEEESGCYVTNIGEPTSFGPCDNVPDPGSVWGNLGEAIAGYLGGSLFASVVAPILEAGEAIDELAEAGSAVEATADADSGSAVVGERMEQRVIPAAQRLGAEIYQPPDAASQAEWDENQRNWIRSIMDQGKTIYDCGPAKGNENYPGITSTAYQIERDEIAARSYPTISIDC
jgi:RHS repeat-associated protein